MSSAVISAAAMSDRTAKEHTAKSATLPGDFHAFEQCILATVELLSSPKLKQGDTVAFITPASWADQDWLDTNVVRLESWGLRVQVGKHVNERLGFLAGSDEDRASDVNAALADAAVRAVVALLGGCGSMRLLRSVDLVVLQADPKPLIGFSDITALHRLWHTAGVASLHGCIDGAHASDVRSQLFGGQPSVVRQEEGAFTASLTTTGTATGPLAGGNLEMLARSVGVAELDLRGCVLLIEANRAAGLGMVDRALTQLILSGGLDHIAGIALGRLDGFEEHLDRGWTVLDVLHDRLDPLGVPILAGLPIGHGPDPRTVPLGTTCRLDASARTLTCEPALR